MTLENISTDRGVENRVYATSTILAYNRQHPQY